MSKPDRPKQKTVYVREDVKVVDYWYEQAQHLGFRTFSGYLRQLLIRELGDGRRFSGAMSVSQPALPPPPLSPPPVTPVEPKAPAPPTSNPENSEPSDANPDTDTL